jgi:hypothetical protein
MSIGTGAQVFLHRQVGETPSAFQDLYNPAPDQTGSVGPADRFATI